MKKRASLFVLWYLRFFAKLQLAKIKPLIIGVGGASGKTSLSNFIYIILADKFKVKQSKGKNSETGIPLDILGLQLKNYSHREWLRIMILTFVKVLTDWGKYDIYIAEMGIDSPLEPKNMAYLLKIIRPDIGVLTNISLEHSVYFDVLIKEENEAKRQRQLLQLTAEQEGLLLTSLNKEQTAVLNIDDENIRQIQVKIKAKIMTIAKISQQADFKIENVKNFVDKFVLRFKNEGKNYEIQITNPLPEHFAYSFLLAIAVAKIAGVSIPDSIKSLENGFSLPPGRMSVFKGIKETVLIDSSYNNATLGPILDLLSFVADVGRQRRRLGIIGDMRELGTMSKLVHEKVAEKILDTLDLAILIGPLSQQYILPILKKHDFPVYSFPNFTSAKSTILEQIKLKDMILIKGSQNTLFLERVVQMLLANPRDKNKLCRRGEYWDKIRDKNL
ncbi:MAG: Mur ligase family protein [Candidatus Levyibacteriota bacterium]|jgi:UDP-N-acetylmuramoyl-tripeptide--D-alanyl-D-alanine ligase